MRGTAGRPFRVSTPSDATEMLMSPLPLWESIGRLRRPFSEKDAEAELRLCRIDRCDPGEGLRTIDRPRPLTPTLSHKGRGGAPPPVQVPDSIFKLQRQFNCRAVLRANGSRECAPDDRLHEAIHRAAQRKNGLLRRCAPRNDGTEMLAVTSPLVGEVGSHRQMRSG